MENRLQSIRFEIGPVNRSLLLASAGHSRRISYAALWLSMPMPAAWSVLSSLRRQLQHITREMGEYYGRGSVFAKNFLADDPKG